VGVPQAVEVSSLAINLAIPKSPILIVASGESEENNKFSGFKSLWAIPKLCK